MADLDDHAWLQAAISDALVSGEYGDLRRSIVDLPAELQEAVEHIDPDGDRIAVVADGSPEADVRLARTFWNDPATGVMRHADAGYDIAIECAHTHKLNLPMI